LLSLLFLGPSQDGNRTGITLLTCFCKMGPLCPLFLYIQAKLGIYMIPGLVKLALGSMMLALWAQKPAGPTMRLEGSDWRRFSIAFLREKQGMNGTIASLSQMDTPHTWLEAHRFVLLRKPQAKILAIMLPRQISFPSRQIWFVYATKYGKPTRLNRRYKTELLQHENKGLREAIRLEKNR